MRCPFGCPRTQLCLRAGHLGDLPSGEDIASTIWRPRRRVVAGLLFRGRPPGTGRQPARPGGRPRIKHSAQRPRRGRQIADFLGPARPSVTLDRYVGRGAVVPTIADAMEDLL
jgi:hypothetical protein